MTAENHIAALQKRHQDLERQIEEEMRSAGYDDLHVTALKRRKLEVKDELAKLQNETRH